MAHHVEEGVGLSLEGNEKVINSQNVVERERLWKSDLLVLDGAFLMHALVTLELFLHELHDVVFCASGFQHHQHLWLGRMPCVGMKSVQELFLMSGDVF